MGLATSGAAKVFEMADWRKGIQAKREIIRNLIVRVILHGESLDFVLEEFRRAIGWYRLADRDRGAAYVMFHDIRSITENWSLIPPKDQDAFLAGKIVPSTLAKQARALAMPA